MARSELAHLELLAEIDAMVDRLNRWADSTPSWPTAEKCRALVRRLTERADSLRIRLEAPLVVATLGGTGTGKSALVNALLGTEAVRTGRARPTTMRPTLLCRPGLTPEMLGIDPQSVELIQADLPALRDLVLVDCPDPDTTEESEPTVGPKNEPVAFLGHDGNLNSNLARLRAILPMCDVLLVTATQQKYRSARVIEELTAAAPGAHLVFVQTHADLEDDIRDDWRKVIAEERRPNHIFRIDSLRAVADAQAGLQPRGEFADLLDLLTRQMAGAAGRRIRRANFLELADDTLRACLARIDEAMPSVRNVQTAIEQQRAALARQIAEKMQSELLNNRRQWENRLLAQSASRWGLSPFALLLRVYQGIGGLIAGAMLYRMRTPAQMALWGAISGARTWQKQLLARRADRAVGQIADDGWNAADLRASAMIVEGYVVEAGLDQTAAQWETIAAEALSASAGFVARVAGELQSLVARLARRHTGWFTRFRYEVLLLAMLVFLLYRLGKNFFYDSWLADPPAPLMGLEHYLTAGLWFVLWCLLLLWMFCRRLRRGLRGEIVQLASGWQNASNDLAIFTRVENECRRVERFRHELEALLIEVENCNRNSSRWDERQ